MLLTQKKRNILSFVALVVSIIWMKEVNYLYYNSIDSPDFDRYFIYLKHFSDVSIEINREHGLLYYYLHYINYFFRYNEFTNVDLFFHKSIQETNFYIYIFGLIGYYKLLKYFNFKNSSIFLTFIFINFFPIAIALRIVFKPEILAFSLLPWIIYCVEKYKSIKDIRYAILSIPLLVGCLTLKGNVLVVVSIYLFFTYFSILFSSNKKHVFIFFTIFISIFSIVTFENLNTSNKNILNLQSGSAEEAFGETYNNKAPAKIVYNTNLYNLVSSPVKHYHADSFIGITLLETTGDYFDLYWDNDSSNYFKSRKEYIEFTTSKEISPPSINSGNKKLTIYLQENENIYVYESIGLMVSLVFYFLLFKYILIEKKYRRFLIAIFFGMVVLLFHSITGIPENNFDPNIGDTLKPLYYSFVFLLSTIFLVVNMVDKSKKSKLYLVLYVLLIILIIGIPKTTSEDLNQDLSYYIEYSEYCEVKNSIYKNLYNINDVVCFDKNDVENLSTEGERFYNNNFLLKPSNLLLLVSSILVSFYLLIFDRKLNTK